ncbi:hypothetical protein EKO04_004424 [Ascochyta lentis]|uniref:Uncharacterized protein n=1 Tax=Ascochyta lentis TaxID=205686 RepID=A0A8H7J6B0_9PLEO|nr:hypothetical protein EKO04_004424 [Ascochyta lentis]
MTSNSEADEFGSDTFSDVDLDAPTSAPGGMFPTPVYNVAGYELKSDFRDPQDTESFDQSRWSNLAADIHTTGWLPWIKAAYKDELVVNSRAIQEKKWEGWVRGCDMALAGTFPEVLQIITTGNLAQSAKNDPILRNKLKEYVKRAINHPAIYVQQLTIGPNNDSLTIEQAEGIARFTRQYTSALSSKASEAFEIDRRLRNDWQRAWTDQGIRALIVDKNQSIQAYKKRILQTFGDTMDKAVEEAKAANQTHIHPMYHVAYAADAVAHAYQHKKKGANTNVLINYTEALLEMWDARLEVRVEVFPICLLILDMFADVAEMFLCRLARGYYYAGGFNQTQCGSVASARGISEEDWQKHRADLDKTFGYNQHLDDELPLRKAFRSKPFEDTNQELEAKLEKLQSNEDALRQKHKELRKNLDPNFMKNNELLAPFLKDWEEVDKFVEDTPRD